MTPPSLTIYASDDLAMPLLDALVDELRRRCLWSRQLQAENLRREFAAWRSTNGG